MGPRKRRVAIMLCICLVMSLLGYTGKATAGSALSVRLIIVDKYVTSKTYTLEKGKKRQLNVRIDNAFGTTTVKFSSNDKSIAKVTKKGFITAKSEGKTKIKAKVTCKSKKKTKTKTVWVRIKVPGDETEEPEETEAAASVSAAATDNLTGELQAIILVNGTKPAQFGLSILNNAPGKQLYDSLPKVLYMTDSNSNTKTAMETDIIYAMDEYKPATLTAGDFMLFGNVRYELTYADHTSGYAYTRLGRVVNPAGLKEALGTGVVSLTIVRGSLPTAPPSATVAPTRTPGGTMTPRPSGYTPTPLPSGVTPSPTPSGMTPAPTVSGAKPSASATVRPSGSPTASQAPTPYGGAKIQVTVGGLTASFILQDNAVANQFYNDLKTNKQTYEMVTQTSERRHYAYLNKNYTYSDTDYVSNWAAGSLLLLSSNEITIMRNTMSNEAHRKSVLLGRLDTTELPEGSTASTFLNSGLLAETTASADFSAG